MCDYIKFGSYNVNGLQASVKRKKVFTMLKEQDLDIIMLQESHSTQNIQHLWQAEWGGKIFCAHGTSESRGVMIAIRRGVIYDIKQIYKDIDGRAIVMEIKIENNWYVFANIYAPNEDDPAFYINVANMIDACENRNVIWAGDFNLVLDILKDRYNSNYNNHKAASTLSAYMHETDLVDVWRALNPQKATYTFFRRQPLAMSRIDFFLISSSLMPSVVEAQIVATPITDHSLVTLRLTNIDCPRGAGLWKLNTSHLSNIEFLKQLNNVVQKDIKTSCNVEPMQRWEFVKNGIINYCKTKSSEIAYERKAKVNKLYQTLGNIKQQMDANPQVYDNIKEQYHEAASQLQDHLEYKARGALLRSKTLWYDQGERSSKYYFSLEKNNAKKKRMITIHTRDGSLTDNQKTILDEQFRFYHALYHSDPNVCFSIKPAPNDPKISNQERDFLEQPLTIEEITASIKEMSNDKSPGCDGLPIEIYKVLWKYIAPIYFEAIQAAIKEGLLMLSARKGLITLIPKKERDLTWLDNWRPLTMLNCDYKIFAKALANRLKKVLPDLISPEQTGFMAHRNISTNIRRTIEIIEYTKKRNVPAFIMSADFEKCFDLIEHRSVWGTLQNFNFGPLFIAQVKLLFNNFTSKVQNNGYLTAAIPITRSLHQGCPISAFLQIICAQNMTNLIKNNNKIQGITLYGLKQTISQFADDTDLFLNYDQQTLDEVLKTFHLLQQNIGFKLNYNKTTLYRIGSLANTNAKLYSLRPLNWTNEPITVLGVLISNNMQNIVIDNFRPIFTKLDGILKNWAARSVTLTGRILIVNTLIASMFVYKMQVLCNIPYKMIELFNEMISLYLWKDKKPKIALKQLMLDKTEGGLRLVDLFYRQMALKAQWVSFIKDNDFWSTVAYNQLCPIAKERIWCCNIHVDDVHLVHNEESFWSQVLYAWCLFNYRMPTSTVDINSQILWYNSHIRVQNTILFNNNAWEAGLIRVSQLFENRQLISYDNIVQRYGPVLTWLQHAQIIAALPNHWKTILFESHGTIVYTPPRYTLLSPMTKITTDVYSYLISRKTDILKKKHTWENRLNVQLDDQEFFDLFKNVSLVTIATKYRDFQFRLLHNAVITNKHLYRYKMRDDNLCSFCALAEESILHLFFECTYVAQLWSDIKCYIDNKTAVSISNNCEWSAECIFFNCVHPTPSHVVNLIVVITKQYIYRQRCLGKKLYADALIKEFQQVYNTEYAIAKYKGKLEKHYAKWSQLDPSLTIKYNEIVQQNEYIQMYLNNM